MTPDTRSDTVHEAVKTFIREELSYGQDDQYDENADLIDQGVIDSMSLLRLVSFLEERFQIRVQDEDLLPANFRSLAAVEAYIKRTLDAGAR